VALPSSITTVTVTGTYVDALGVPVTGEVTFELSEPLRDANDKIVLAPTPIRATLDGSGHFSTVLPVTDDTTLAPSGWTYTVTERIDRWQSNTWRFALLASQGPTVDLSQITPLT
jgi:hypothetical protein